MVIYYSVSVSMSVSQSVGWKHVGVSFPVSCLSAEKL